MTVYCPRCGEPMTSGVCDNCGFPIIKMRKRSDIDFYEMANMFQ